MIINEKDDKVLIDLKSYTKITKSLGIKYESTTWREHIKRGVLDGGIGVDGAYMVWVDVLIYNAVFRQNMCCSNCQRLESKLENIKLLAVV